MTFDVVACRGSCRINESLLLAETGLQTVAPCRSPRKSFCAVIEAEEFKPRLAEHKQRLARLPSDRSVVMAADDAERSLQLLIGRSVDFAGRVSAGLDQLNGQGGAT